MNNRPSEQRLRLLAGDEDERPRGNTMTLVFGSVQDIQRHFNYDKKIYLFFIFLATIKSICSLWVLLYTNEDCDQPYRIWLWFMLIHDLLQISCSISTILLFSRINAFVERSLAAREDLEASQSRQTLRAFSEEVLQSKRNIDNFTGLKNLIYVLLFLNALLYLNSSENCTTDAPNLTKVVTFYIQLQWLGQIILPCCLLLLACLCMPMILPFIASYGPQATQIPASPQQIRNLGTTTYNPSVHTQNECGICLTEYNQGDQIIELPCSGKHYFHSECITQWLQVSGVCPLCRARVP